MTNQEKKALINSFGNWRQTIDFGDGLFSPGKEKDTFTKPDRWGSPELFNKKSVLDIGAWDGFLSF